MTDEEGGWDDLWDVPAPDPPTIIERVDWAIVTASLNSAPESAPDRLQQPETGADGEQESNDALTLFGSPDQFHVAWQHWNGMPEFHMDSLHPDSTVVVKFRTPEDREAFAELIGRPLRKEESRGIWYPNIVIAHFWDKVYSTHTDETDLTKPHRHTYGPFSTPEEEETVLDAEEEMDEAIGGDETADEGRVGET